MGIKFVSNGSVAPWHSKVVPPVTRGLEGWFNFDTAVERFTFNRAIGKPDALLVGEPVAYATHGRFKGLTNFLKTQINESDEQTLIVVGKAVALPTSTGDSTMLIGNWYGTPIETDVTGNAAGVNLYMRTATTLSASAGRRGVTGNVVAGSASVTGTVPTKWAIRAVRAKSGDPTKVFDFTAGVSAVGADSSTRVRASTPFCIGSAMQDYGGECDISAAAIYKAALTDAELEKVVALMRVRLRRLGIVA